jgi:hypothetical protein
VPQALGQYAGRCMVAHLLQRLARFYHQVDALAFELSCAENAVRRHATVLKYVEILRWEARLAFPDEWFQYDDAPPEWKQLGRALRSVESVLEVALRRLQQQTNPEHSQDEFRDCHKQAGDCLLSAGDCLWESVGAVLAKIRKPVAYNSSETM